MKAFVTGSRAYGKPKASSDLDLVVLVDGDTAAKLIAMSEDEKKCVFGKLNLILCESEAEFCIWKLATERIKKESRQRGKPFTRDEAKAVLDEYRDDLGMKDEGGSGD